MRSKVVFLDRDNTIIRNALYCVSPDQVKILPSVPEAIRLLNTNGFKVIVITNQSCIKRGYLSEKGLDKIHDRMKNELSKQGAYIDAIYYCPHHPDSRCPCRKPNNGLLVQASKDFDIDFGRSFMVGDLPMDIEAGKSMGCKTVLLSNFDKTNCYPDYITKDLLGASKWITSKVVTSIIIPAYNEERGLTITLYKLSKVIDDTYEVIVVDDGCTDRTLDALIQYPYKVIQHKVNQGKGEAIKEGIVEAKGRNIIWLDADDSYPIEFVPDMAKALNGDYDVVVCSRFYGRKNIPIFNRIGNWIFKTTIRKFYGFKPFDPMTGLYGVRKQHLLRMNLTSKRFAIEPEISIKGARMGLEMLDIPAEYKVRVGRTKLNAIKVGFEDTTTILGLMLWKPK